MDTYLSLADKLTNETIIESEIGQRVTKTLKPRIIYLPEGGFGKANGFFNEGTIVTIISTEKSEYLSGLESAIKNKNTDRIQLHCEAIIERARKDTSKPAKEGGLDDIPLIVDVLYGNTWIAKHLLIAPYTQLAISASVWSGGKLNNQAFRVLEHRQKKSRIPDVQVFTILIPPKLTKIEKAVLKAAPDDLSEIHINSPSVSWSAAGLRLKWNRDEMFFPQQEQGQQQIVEKHGGIIAGLTFDDRLRFLVPFLEKDVMDKNHHQHQQQQKDTMQQQQQQQHYNDDKQQHQQQQQQQKQADGQQQQQQQEQHQDAKTGQQQDQNQQQQQAQTEQQQDDDQHHEHDAATGQAADGSSMWRDELDGGFVIRPIDQERYASLLDRIDFESIDATQSVKELLRVRERLLTIGMG